MELTTAEKINIGWLCGLYASNELQNGKRHGGLLDERLPSLLYSVTQGLSWLNDLAPNDTDIEPIGNYLISICKHYFKARNVIDSGGIVPGIVPAVFDFEYLIEVFGGIPDFANATDYNNVKITGHNLVVFWNDIPRFLIAGSEWAYTPLGIRILIGGFDATVNDYNFKIFIKDPFGISGSGSREVTRSFQYTGIGGETTFFASLLNGSTIIEVARGTAYEMINTGTPTGLQALVPLLSGLSNGNITFASDNPIGAGEVVSIIFSKSI